jgi:hypothetical protein
MADPVATQIGSIAGYISLCLMIVGSLIAAINHRRISSECCGRRGSVSLDINATTPPDKKSDEKPTVSVPA